MRKRGFSRRDVLKGTTALAATVFASPIKAAPPPAAAITPELIAAAKKEGKVTFYTAMDLQFAQQAGKVFEEKFPGISVRVERSGAERVFSRIAQEYGSNVRAVDVVNTADAAHCIVWKRNNWLEAYLPEDVAKHFDKNYFDPDGFHATTRILVSPIAYNTNLVKKEEAPKSYADLLDPKWAGKIVKAHPGYSGTILTATHQTARDVGWDYFEKLAKQRVMQVQSASDPPKKLALGERAIMADGIEYGVFQLKEGGKPVDVIYPVEGSPLIVGPNGVLKNAPNPNAARLFQSFALSAECQQFNVDFGGLRSAHKLVKDKRGRKPLSEIKVMKDDAAAVEKESEEIKKRYTQYFRV
jgi:iron(III) transport system substrate-binding protein